MKIITPVNGSELSNEISRRTLKKARKSISLSAFTKKDDKEKKSEKSGSEKSDKADKNSQKSVQSKMTAFLGENGKKEEKKRRDSVGMFLYVKIIRLGIWY